MNYLELLDLLRQSGSDSPSAEAVDLFAHFTGRTREWCLLHRTDPLPDSIRKAAEKRRDGIPLQYILGEAWFYGDRYLVSPDCLIPQPDTEILADLALHALRPGQDLLDLCTGSGCIAVSILKRVPDANGIAVDLSAAALALAKRNAQENGVGERLVFFREDILHSERTPSEIAAADVIVSNPPYINTDVIPTLSAEVRHEPLMALDGGTDGMVFYRRLVSLASFLRPSGVMFLEIGYDQRDRVEALCREAGLLVRFHRDFGGIDRVAEIRRSV